MNDTSPEASIQRFVADLKRIREARDVSLADIREATRVSKDVLNDFESGDLFNRSSFNPVYLRSLAKSYAQHVGIAPAQRVLEYMELAQANRYTNELAVDELDEEPLSIAWPDDEIEESDKADPENAAATAPIDDSAFDDSPSSAAQTTAASNPNASNTAEAGARRWRSASEKETATSKNDSASSSASAGGEARQLIVLGLVFVLLLGGLVWGLVQWSGSDGTTSESEAPSEETTLTPPDTAQSEAASPDTSQADAPERPAPELGDTIYAMFYASNGNVQGLRVQRDDDARRPYWIEEGDAIVMPFAERIVIEEEFDQFALFINEYPMPLEPLDNQGRRVLTRDDLTAWADTTQTPPADNLPTPADTLRIP